MFLKAAISFTLQLEMYESSSYSTSLPKCRVLSHFNCSHSNGVKVSVGQVSEVVSVSTATAITRIPA